jgi:hypothetical protein
LSVYFNEPWMPTLTMMNGVKKKVENTLWRLGVQILRSEVRLLWPVIPMNVVAEELLFKICRSRRRWKFKFSDGKVLLLRSQIGMTRLVPELEVGLLSSDVSFNGPAGLLKRWSSLCHWF